MDGLKDAYRNKVHADACKDSNPELADELYELEKKHLERVEELTST